MTSPNPSTPPPDNEPREAAPDDASLMDPHDILLRRNPADLDIQEGQERLEDDPAPPPGKTLGKTTDDKPADNPATPPATPPRT